MPSSAAAKSRQGAQTEVIVIGLGKHPGGERLASQLKAAGVEWTDANEPDALSELLRNGRRAVVVVYSPLESARAEAVLDRLHQNLRRAPVLVLVDRADFSQYYDLMGRGASDYYEMSEGAERIARAVRHAAQNRAC